MIIPTFNAGEYLLDAVRSVLAQSYAAVECIVVDDGSTDDTSDRLLPFTDRIRWRRQANRGRTAARSAGLAMASGDMIAFLDADDYWAADKIERQMTLIESDPRIGVVGCAALKVDVSGLPIRPIRAAPSPRLACGVEGFLSLVTQAYGLAAPMSAILLRRTCLDSVGGFDPEINTMEEWDLLLRIIQDWDIACVMEPVLVYNRIYGFHTPSKVAPRRRQDKYLEVVDRAFARRGDRAELQEQETHARALAQLRGALVEYAVGDHAAGAARLADAHRLKPTLFEGSTSDFERILVYSAAYQYDAVTPVAESIDFMKRLLQTLPVDLAGLRERESALMERLRAIQLHDALLCGDLPRLRQILPGAILGSPGLLKDRGIRALSLRALRPSRPRPPIGIPDRARDSGE